MIIMRRNITAESKSPGINREYILGLAVDRIDYQTALSKIESYVCDGGKHLVVTPYAESVVAALHDEEFREVVHNSSLSVPDGGSLLAASEYLSYHLPKNKFLRVPLALVLGLWVGARLAFAPQTFKNIKSRVSGTDLVESLCKLSSLKGYKVYFLGGGAASASEAAGVMRAKNPKLMIQFDGGPARLRDASKEVIDSVIKSINDFGPDFLFVAFKPVEQEKWLAAHMGQINAKVFMAVGGAFNMISGRKARAPKILQRFNLEWLWRLMIEPSRIGRIFNAVIVFPWLVFKSKISTR